MRVAVVSESFLPTVNGVTTSVLHILDHLARNGHEAIVIVPAAGAPDRYAGFPVIEVPAISYRQFPVGLPNPQLQSILEEFRPDVTHVAAPFLLGAQAIAASDRLGIGSVAIFQTDVAGYADSNRLGAATRAAWRMIRWIHDKADLTLAPSTSARTKLDRAGVRRVQLWGRGVDLERYHPRNRLDPAVAALRSSIAPGGGIIVGYVGRLAPEKEVERLASLASVTGSAAPGAEAITIALVGDGPAAASIARALRDLPVRFLGALHGRELALAYAAFDVFVHTGTRETFGQTIQEAHASGLPVVAPRAGGPIDLIDDSVTGLLFDPASDTQLAKAIARLRDDAPLRRRLGEAGRRSVREKSWDATCHALLGWYREVIALRAVSSAVRQPQ